MCVLGGGTCLTVTFSKENRPLCWDCFSLTSTDCLARIMLQQLRFCIYRGKMNLKLPNAVNVFFVMYYTFAVFIFCLIWGRCQTLSFFLFITESSQRGNLKQIYVDNFSTNISL